LGKTPNQLIENQTTKYTTLILLFDIKVLQKDISKCLIISEIQMLNIALFISTI
jgi:hypothetical protein